MNSAREHSADEALAQLSAMIEPVQQSETLDLAAAHGRALASPVEALLDLPPFDNAAMDGYALRAGAAGTDGSFEIIGELRAGHRFVGTLEPGQAVRIMTGAPLPMEADAVAMLEHVAVSGNRLRPTEPVAPRMHVRQRGEHLRLGEILFAAGHRLSSVDIGLAASAGVARVLVRRRLRIGMLSTGDELVDAPAPLPPGAIYDGNRPLLLALARRAGHEAVDLGIAMDAERALAAQLDRASTLGLDVLITTGGASVGDADIVRQHAGVRFIALDFRPGRGIVAGRLQSERQRLLLLGLPGNAVAAFVTYQRVVAPLLAHAAHSSHRALSLRLPLASAARGKARTEWRRARFVTRAGATAVEPMAEQGSAMLRTVSEADALIEIGAQAELAVGALVDVLALNPGD
jgi:molybdopterin molybdotransferase